MTARLGMWTPEFYDDGYFAWMQQAGITFFKMDNVWPDTLATRFRNPNDGGNLWTRFATYGLKPVIGLPIMTGPEKNIENWTWLLQESGRHVEAVNMRDDSSTGVPRGSSDPLHITPPGPGETRNGLTNWVKSIKSDIPTLCYLGGTIFEAYRDGRITDEQNNRQPRGTGTVEFWDEYAVSTQDNLDIACVNAGPAIFQARQDTPSILEIKIHDSLFSRDSRRVWVQRRDIVDGREHVVLNRQAELKSLRETLADMRMLLPGRKYHLLLNVWPSKLPEYWWAWKTVLDVIRSQPDVECVWIRPREHTLVRSYRIDTAYTGVPLFINQSNGMVSINPDGPWSTPAPGVVVDTSTWPESAGWLYRTAPQNVRDGFQKMCK